ncbi:WD40 repeat domain-containing serine/threonine-protein kinase [Streptomyces bambusae]|uniref:Protein kinase n=1 Tax=Streptomyces bambusae TaxID=1550616 RepID=A0ABS6Z0F4_9ACTN|nr:WD40 repeat domain-containing serine/threonine-protein kinase [Streptomyces bambusae]MBW5481223.1 protein kinase [Streptomyces bambusae]
MGSALLPEDPEQIAGYWLASRLGVGGQGVVYEAYDGQGTRVALKVLHRTADAFVHERFGREAEAARRVAPFCTARILDVSTDAEVPYLVSEFVPGPTLAARVRTEGPFAEDRLLRLAAGVATALAAIHRAGVVHRDLKPGNVLLGPDGPRIIDFGIARAPDMSLTATGAIMGTYGYMAPEILSGKRATAASDIFAWGAVVLFAATGDEPFRGENIAEAAHRVTTVDPDLSALPVSVRPLVATALAKEPALRPSARELLLALVGESGEATESGEGGASGEGSASDESFEATLLQDGARRAEPATPPSATEVVAPLGERAEAAFAALPAEAQVVAHEAVLRLVVPGPAPDGTHDSVRSCAAAELFTGRPEREQRAMAAATEALVAAGALVIDEDSTVRPVSAALLPAWRRLAAWVAADRAGIAIRLRLTQAALVWEAHGRRAEDLPRGTELRRCLDWLATVPHQLRPNPLELACLDAARAAAGRTVRRRRQLVSGLAGVTVLAVLAGLAAWYQNNEVERREAEATARRVAQAAESLRGTEPETARLLGLAAWRIAGVPEARAALNASSVQRATETLQLPRIDYGISAGVQLTQGGQGMLLYTPNEATFTDLGLGGKSAPPRTPRKLPGNVHWGEGQKPAVSPDGRYVLVMTDAQHVQVVETATGTPLGPAFALAVQSARGLSLTNRGQVVRELDSGAFRMTDGQRGGAEVELPGELSPDGSYVVSCDRSRGTVVASAYPSSGAAPLVTNSERSCDRTTVFSPDGSSFARVEHGGSGDGADSFGEANVWRVRGEASGPPLPDLGLHEFRLSSRGGYVFGWSGNGEVEIWETEGRNHLVTLPGAVKSNARSSSPYADMALDEDTKSLVFLTSDRATLKRIDLSGVVGLPKPDRNLVAAASSADGTTVVVREGWTDMKQRVVDVRTGKTLHTVPQRWVELPTRHVFNALSDNGKVLAFTDHDPDQRKQFVVVHDLEHGREIHRFSPVDETVRRLVVSADGRYLSAFGIESGVREGEGGTIQVWDVRERNEIHRIDNVFGYGRFSPDGTLFATTTGTVIDLRSGTRRDGAWGGAATGLAFSPDSRLLAVVRDSGSVELWDGAARTRLSHLPGSPPRDTARFDFADDPVFSQDGRLLAAVTGGERIQLWDTDARLALGGPLETSGRKVDLLSFGGDGILRVLSGADTAPLDLVPDRVAAAVCKRAGRDITRAEWRTYIPNVPYRKLC